VHLVVTSPPYWSLKDYGGDPREIGRPQSAATYFEALAGVWRECFRLLHPGCRLAVNVGDQFLRARDHGRYRVLPIGAETVRAGCEAGFDFMGNIVWHKVTTTKTTGGCSLMGSMYFPKDGHVTYEHEYICLFRKPGKWPRPSEAQKRASELGKEERSLWFRGLWRIAPERQKGAEGGHAAMFPLELPERLIRMYSFAGEVVLDPFLGSGTTALAALRSGRGSIGVELNEGRYRAAIEARLGRASRVTIGASVT
jgi:site-specific DNA-methyltransferase (adenine-specific)